MGALKTDSCLSLWDNPSHDTRFLFKNFLVGNNVRDILNFFLFIHTHIHTHTSLLYLALCRAALRNEMQKEERCVSSTIPLGHIDTYDARMFSITSLACKLTLCQSHVYHKQLAYGWKRKKRVRKHGVTHKLSSRKDLKRGVHKKRNEDDENHEIMAERFDFVRNTTQIFRDVASTRPPLCLKITKPLYFTLITDYIL